MNMFAIGVDMDKNALIHVEKQPYIFRYIQKSQHKDDVFLAVLELPVFKVPVNLAISQDEVFGQVFEVGSDIGVGFHVPLEPKASAGPVYLFQQLQCGARTDS